MNPRFQLIELDADGAQEITWHYAKPTAKGDKPFKITDRKTGKFTQSLDFKLPLRRGTRN